MPGLKVDGGSAGARLAAPEPRLPENVKVGDSLLLADHGKLRTTLQLTGGVALVGGIGATAYLVANRGRLGLTGPLPFVAAGGVALLGLALGIIGQTAPRNEMATVLAADLARADAFRTADARNVDTGVVRDGDRYAVVGFDRDRNLDSARLDRLRVGDGAVPFEGLVTRDGDELAPVGPGEGYTNNGALDRLDLAARPFDRNAVIGRQLGTDSRHAPARVGDPIGNPSGYSSAKDAAVAARDIDRSEHVIVHAGDRYYAYNLEGPSRTSLAARGTALEPFSAIQVQHGKALYGADAPRASFSFQQRFLPFTTDEPLGHSVRVPGSGTYTSAVVQDHRQSTRDRHQAVRSAIGEAMQDAWWGGWDDYWDRYNVGGYAVIHGDTEDAQGDYHVYSMSDRYGGSSRPTWDDNLGRVEATIRRVTETRSDTWREGDYLVTRTEKRQELRLAERGVYGERDIAATPWRETGRTRRYSPLSSGNPGPGGPRPEPNPTRPTPTPGNGGYNGGNQPPDPGGGYNGGNQPPN